MHHGYGRIPALLYHCGAWKVGSNNMCASCPCPIYGALSSTTGQKCPQCLFQCPQTQLRLWSPLLNTRSFPKLGLFLCSSVPPTPCCCGFIQGLGSSRCSCLLFLTWASIPGDSLGQSKGACSLQTSMCSRDHSGASGRLCKRQYFSQ